MDFKPGFIVPSKDPLKMYLAEGCKVEACKEYLYRVNGGNRAFLDSLAVPLFKIGFYHVETKIPVLDLFLYYGRIEQRYLELKHCCFHDGRFNSEGTIDEAMIGCLQQEYDFRSRQDTAYYLNNFPSKIILL